MKEKLTKARIANAVSARVVNTAPDHAESDAFDSCLGQKLFIIEIILNSLSIEYFRAKLWYFPPLTWVTLYQTTKLFGWISDFSVALTDDWKSFHSRRLKYDLSNYSLHEENVWQISSHFDNEWAKKR